MNRKIIFCLCIVFLFIFFNRSLADTPNVFGSISTKMGLAPVAITEFTVVGNVNDGTITSPDVISCASKLA